MKGKRKHEIGKTFVLLAVMCAVLCAPGYKDIVTNISKASDMHTVVLDPGHGGIDGGAESSEGVNEKEINLAIAAALKEALENENIEVIMTRERDEGLYDEEQKGAIRSLKTEDMKKRKAAIDEADADLAVSIHLNSFTQDPGVKGAQVFYPSYGDSALTCKSENAAKIMQNNLNRNVNGKAARTELAKNDVYLFKNICCPIVIVECGFLSNREDSENLQTVKHQRKIVKALTEAICKYLDKNST